MAKLWIVLALFVVAGGYYLNQSYNEAMAACQVKYSYDTCFHSLNR